MHRGSHPVFAKLRFIIDELLQQGPDAISSVAKNEQLVLSRLSRACESSKAVVGS